jgi:hypothetical protein
LKGCWGLAVIADFPGLLVLQGRGLPGTQDWVYPAIQEIPDIREFPALELSSPEIQDIQVFPDTPVFLATQELRGIRVFQDIPAILALPGILGIQEFPAIQDIPVTQEFRGIPVGPVILEHQAIPGVVIPEPQVILVILEFRDTPENLAILASLAILEFQVIPGHPVILECPDIPGIPASPVTLVFRGIRVIPGRGIPVIPECPGIRVIRGYLDLRGFRVISMHSSRMCGRLRLMPE